MTLPFGDSDLETNLMSTKCATKHRLFEAPTFLATSTVGGTQVIAAGRVGFQLVFPGNNGQTEPMVSKLSI